MKNLLKFIFFIIYSISIFFLPNSLIILVPTIINLLIFFFNITNVKKIIKSTLLIFPFIVFTFIINCVLDNLFNAFCISVKLILVCNITIIYSTSSNINEIAETIQILCTPLKIFNINIDEIKIIIAISLSLIPTMKKELFELKDSCKAKNIPFTIKNIKYILSKFLLSVIMRVSQIEESLIAKGYKY